MIEEEFDEESGRGRSRSPRFPVIGLSAAVEAAQKIYSKEKRGEVPADIAVQHLGYSGLNGRARRVLSAVKAFGLLAEGASSQVRISEPGLVVMAYPPGSPEREEALRKLAFNPPIFQKLKARFGDDLSEMSDQNLKAKLITEFNFLDDSAEELVRALRETLAFTRTAAKAAPPTEEGSGKETSTTLPTAHSAKPAFQPATSETAVWRVVLPLGRGVSVEMVANAPLSSAQLELLKGHIDVLIRVAESDAT